MGTSAWRPLAVARGGRFTSKTDGGSHREDPPPNEAMYCRAKATEAKRCAVCQVLAMYCRFAEDQLPHRLPGPQAGGDPLLVGTGGHDDRLEAGLLRHAQAAAGTHRPAGALARQGLHPAALVGGEPAAHAFGADPEDGRDGVGGEAGLASGHRPQAECRAHFVGKGPRIEQGDGHDSTSPKNVPRSRCQDTTPPKPYPRASPLYLVAGVIVPALPTARSGLPSPLRSA